MNQHVKEVVPFSLKDAPSLIERIFPSMKISAEAKQERDAGRGQTLPALGSYWKGRKPLILVRACLLASLLPATNRPDEDLQIFEMLMEIDDAALFRRAKNHDVLDVRDLSYDERVGNAWRPEEMGHTIHLGIWDQVNAHLGTHASSFTSLVEQLGIMRFGVVPTVCDPFAGGGSIPFESARLGCHVIASDLNPIACMLTWGGIHIIGADDKKRAEIQAEQNRIARLLDNEITQLGFEHNRRGDRAKAYLYCLETNCPETGWSVPMLPSRLISKKRRIIVDLVPNADRKRYDFRLNDDPCDAEFSAALKGTVVNGRLVHPMQTTADGISISSIRGDYKDSLGKRSNKLRSWDKEDFTPRPSDIFRERLYCIQWIHANSIRKGRQETYFAVPDADDLDTEKRVEDYVRSNIVAWQRDGLVPDMQIESGEETSRLLRERGWTHWHHLKSARDIIFHALLKAQIIHPETYISFAKQQDFHSKLVRWDRISLTAINTMYNQALNTNYDWCTRSSFIFCSGGNVEYKSFPLLKNTKKEIYSCPAKDTPGKAEIFITDPPYADAVNYHEITEFFIAWLRKNPPKEFADWNWDSRRRLAIKGKGEEFRTSMVEAYKAMADHMPDNGIQIVMFTHQDGKVWSDMAQIFWGAGLQVMADWYIATETTSELKKGGYVQGTHIIVLRKRSGNESGYSDEITQEVKDEVARQIEEMTGLNQSLKGKGRSENLFNDADLQMAGYAAALRVLTKYVKIDGKDMTVEAMRPRAKNERTVIDDIIEYAVQVANEHLVPEGMDEHTWRRLTGTERFYLKMMDIETTGAKKVDNYQNFAKAFRVPDYGALMSSVSANSAALKSAADFGKRQMGDDEFGTSITRAVLYALWEMANGVDDDVVVGHVRDLVDNYLDRRADIVSVANYIGAKRSEVDREESQNAGVLAGLIKNERLG